MTNPKNAQVETFLTHLRTNPCEHVSGRCVFVLTTNTPRDPKQTVRDPEEVRRTVHPAPMLNVDARLSLGSAARALLATAAAGLRLGAALAVVNQQAASSDLWHVGVHLRAAARSSFYPAASVPEGSVAAPYCTDGRYLRWHGLSGGLPTARALLLSRTFRTLSRAAGSGAAVHRRSVPAAGVLARVRRQHGHGHVPLPRLCSPRHRRCRPRAHGRHRVIHGAR